MRWYKMAQELAGTLHAGTLAALQLRPDGFIDYLQQEGGFRLVRGTVLLPLLLCMSVCKANHTVFLSRAAPPVPSG